jgi:hypothetical protein
MHHYRNYKAYIPETRGVRTTNTIEFFPDKVDMPSTSSADRLAAATEDLVAALKNHTHQHHSSTWGQQPMMQSKSYNLFIYHQEMNHLEEWRIPVLGLSPFLNFPGKNT